MKSLFYFFIKNLLYCYNYIYFRKVKIYGKENIPKEGGVLYSPNHQGAFLDPLLIGTLTPNKVTSLTRSDVFGGPLQWFMDALNMLPVYRIRNGYSNLKKNDAIFEKCYKILGNSGNLMMFSEGGHHNEYFLQNLSKGSSRLAYQAQQMNPDAVIYIMPVGINYGHHRLPRCTLHLVFGTPILIKDFIDVTKSEAENINTLRGALQERMKDCLWLPDNNEQYTEKKELINAASTRRSFLSLKNELAKEQPKLPAKKKKSSVRLFAIALLSFPNIIPLIICKKTLALFKDIVFYGSMNYSFGVVIFPLYWLLSGGLLYAFFNFNFAALYLAISFIALFLMHRVKLS